VSDRVNWLLGESPCDVVARWLTVWCGCCCSWMPGTRSVLKIETQHVRNLTKWRAHFRRWRRPSCTVTSRSTTSTLRLWASASLQLVFTASVIVLFVTYLLTSLVESLMWARPQPLRNTYQFVLH